LCDPYGKEPAKFEELGRSSVTVMFRHGRIGVSAKMLIESDLLRREQCPRFEMGGKVHCP
jgi:hypothetical protein